MLAVLLMELRAMLREPRDFLIPMSYALVLSAAACLFLVPAGPNPTHMGVTIISLVEIVQTFALLVVAPLVGSAAIAGERERGTWTPLIASPVSRTGLAFGKAASAMLFVVLVLTMSMPLAALAMLLAAADEYVVGGMYLTHIVVGVTLTCLGVFISTFFRRTWSAALVAIALSFGLVLVTSALFSALPVQGGPDYHDDRWRILLWCNPGYGTFLFFVGDALTPRAEPSDGLSHMEWWYHYGAMAVMTAMCLAGTIVSVNRMRD